MASTQPPFDIRQFVKDADKDNDVIQASYNTVNRMVALIGDIPFQTLFTQDWSQLVPDLLPRVQSAEQENLIKSAESVSALLQKLQASDGISFYDLVNQGYDSARQPTYDILRDLWRQGIYFPTLTNRTSADGDVKQALNDLLAVAPDLTYQEVYTKAKESVSPEMVMAVHQALQTGVLYLLVNNQCCHHPPTGGEFCVAPAIGKTCTMTGNRCTVGSDDCPS